MKKITLCSLTLLVMCFSCGKNREVSSTDGPNFSEIHDNFHYHFDQIAIDGSEYYILKEDRNNPHEGFGFMALKGGDIKKNQDSIKAYLKTILELQVQQLAARELKPEEEINTYVNDLFAYYLKKSKSPYYVQPEDTLANSDSVK